MEGSEGSIWREWEEGDVIRRIGSGSRSRASPPIEPSHRSSPLQLPRRPFRHPPLRSWTRPSNGARAHVGTGWEQFAVASYGRLMRRSVLVPALGRHHTEPLQYPLARPFS